MQKSSTIINSFHYRTPHPSNSLPHGVSRPNRTPSTFYRLLRVRAYNNALLDNARWTFWTFARECVEYVFQICQHIRAPNVHEIVHPVQNGSFRMRHTTCPAILGNGIPWHILPRAEYGAGRPMAFSEIASADFNTTLL